jgi:hypothetical protein
VLDQFNVCPPHEIKPVNFGVTRVGGEFVVGGDGQLWDEVHRNENGFIKKQNL